MKNSAVDSLRNKLVADLHVTSDAVGIKFTDGAKLSVFNKYVLVGVEQLDSLKGARLLNLVEFESHIDLLFDGGRRVEVGMQNEDWNGPEAIELILVDGQIVVWN